MQDLEGSMQTGASCLAAISAKGVAAARPARRVVRVIEIFMLAKD